MLDCLRIKGIVFNQCQYIVFGDILPLRLSNLLYWLFFSTKFHGSIFSSINLYFWIDDAISILKRRCLRKEEVLTFFNNFTRKFYFFFTIFFNLSTLRLDDAIRRTIWIYKRIFFRFSNCIFFLKKSLLNQLKSCFWRKSS